MGKIHNQLSLQDLFSGTFGRYIQLARQASGQTMAATTAAKNLGSALGSSAAQATQAAQETQMASAAQQTAVQSTATAAQQAAATQVQAANAAAIQQQNSAGAAALAAQQTAQAQAEAAQEAAAAQQQATTAVEAHNRSMKAAEASARNYRSALDRVEQKLIAANARFDELYAQEQRLISAGEQTTAAFRKLDAQLEKQGSSIRVLEAQQTVLTQKYGAATDAVQRESAALAQAQNTQAQAAQQAAAAQKLAAQAAQEAAAAQQRATQAAEASASALQGQTAAYRTAADAAQQAAATAERAAGSEQTFQASADKAAGAAGGLTRQLKTLAGAYLSVQTLNKAIDLSDTLVSGRSRLDRMNDGLQTTAELETMIFQSAQRSRGSFMDTMGLVSQLGTMAGDAFDNTQEVVAFAEQLNKQLALSGTSGASEQAAITQLEQGLASGVLRGDELNSVMEQTPVLAKTIADYLGVSIGQLRSMGAEGQITASIVKNALFAAAKETNEEFAKTPMTWAQVWTLASNMAIRAMDPLLSAINWTANHLDTLVPIVLSVGSAFGVMLIAANWTNILASASQKAAAVQAFLNAVMAANPAALAAAGVLLLVGALYAGVAAMNHFKGTSISATGFITGAFAVMGAFILNSTIIPLYNAFASFANFMGNVFTNPLAAIKILFYDMAITVMSYLQNIAHGLEGLLNHIPGVSVSFTSGIDALVTKLQRDRRYEKWASDYTEYFKPMQNIDLGKAYSKGYDWGKNFNPADLLSGLMGGMGSLEVPQAANSSDLLKSIDQNTGKIAKTVDLSDEDLKMLVDVAERKYINKINLTAQTPTITIYGQNTGDTEQDTRNVAEMLCDLLLEQLHSGSTVTVP